jgi:hypothetical protein
MSEYVPIAHLLASCSTWPLDTSWSYGRSQSQMLRFWKYLLPSFETASRRVRTNRKFRTEMREYELDDAYCKQHA